MDELEGNTDQIRLKIDYRGLWYAHLPFLFNLNTL